MKSLTKKQRHLVYKKALLVLKKVHCNPGAYTGICSCISSVCENSFPKQFSYYDRPNIDDFTEFLWLSPHDECNAHDAWFDKVISKKYLRKRIQRHQQTILEFCIAITK